MPEAADEGLFTAVTVVDHIVPHRGDRALFWDKSNWQPLCTTCHNRKTVSEDGGFIDRHTVGTQQVAIVCGPPGSGKTTYVRERASWGDLVVDLDAIFSAMTGLLWYEKPATLVPFIHDLRDSIYRMIEHEKVAPHVWIITPDARESERELLRERFNAEVVVLDVSPLECMNRIMKDDRRRDRAAAWEKIVDGSWRTYERSRISTDREG